MFGARSAIHEKDSLVSRFEAVQCLPWHAPYVLQIPSDIHIIRQDVGPHCYIGAPSVNIALPLDYVFGHMVGSMSPTDTHNLRTTFGFVQGASYAMASAVLDATSETEISGRKYHTSRCERNSVIVPDEETRPRPHPRNRKRPSLKDSSTINNDLGSSSSSSQSPSPSSTNTNSDPTQKGPIRYKRTIYKLKPYNKLTPDTEGWHSGLPHVRLWNWIQHALCASHGSTMGPDLAEKQLPRWVRSSFAHAVRPWLIHGLTYPKYTWYPCNLGKIQAQSKENDEEILSRYTVYCTIVSRVQFLDELIESGKLPIDIARQAALWLDSHQMMMIHMTQTGLYTDEQIHAPITTWPGYDNLKRVNNDEDPLKTGEEGSGTIKGDSWFDELFDSLINDDCIPGSTVPPGGSEHLSGQLSHYQFYEPSLQHVMHQGELPNLNVLMHRIEWWNEHCEGDDETLDVDLRSMNDLMRKARPYPQQSRSMHNICARRVLVHPRIAEFFRRFIMCSMGGLYENIGSQVLACFYVRQALYHWLLYWPATAEDIATWLNGSETEDVLHTASVRTQKGRKRAEYYDSDEYSPYNVPPSALVGSNKKRVEEGRVNNTNLCQFILNQYIILLTEGWGGMKRALADTNWYVLVRDTYVQAMDRVCSMSNQWFVTSKDREDGLLRARLVTLYSERLTSASPTAKLRINAHTYPPRDAFHDGRSYLARLARDYTPWLRWHRVVEFADRCLGSPDGPPELYGVYTDHFREVVTPSGLIGELLFGQNRIPTLWEAMVFRCRQYVLRFSNRLTRLDFFTCVLSEMTKVQVDYFNVMSLEKQQALGIVSGYGPDGHDPPPEHSNIMRGVVQYYIHSLKRIPSFEWMTVMFDLPLFPIVMLCVARTYYSGEVFHRPLVSTIWAIALTHPRTFFYLKKFLMTLRQEVRHRIQPLPEHIRQRQLQALAKRHNADPADQLHMDYVSTVFFCGPHGCIKHSMVDVDKPSSDLASVSSSSSNSKNSKKTSTSTPTPPSSTSNANTSATVPAAVSSTTPIITRSESYYGTTNVVTDPYTGEMFCSKQLSALNVLKAAPVHEALAAPIKPGGKPPSDAARRVYAQHNNKVQLWCCFNEPLRQVSLLGGMLIMDQIRVVKLFMLCPECAGLTQVDASKFNTPLGFMCRRCSSTYIYRNAQESLMRRVYAKINSQLPPRVCYQCSLLNPHVRSRELHSHRVFDNLSSPPHFTDSYLCNVHNRTFLREAPDAILLSNIALCVNGRLRAMTQGSTDDVLPTNRDTVALVPHHNEEIFVRNTMHSYGALNRASKSGLY